MLTKFELQFIGNLNSFFCKMCHCLITSTVHSHLKQNHMNKLKKEEKLKLKELFEFNSELKYELPDKVEGF